MKTQILVVLFVLSFSLVQSDGPRYCGRRLSETLVKYCSNGDMVKRSESLMRAQLFGEGYWLTPQRALAMGRGKRHDGIATECCENSCTIQELLAYCPE